LLVDGTGKLRGEAMGACRRVTEGHSNEHCTVRGHAVELQKVTLMRTAQCRVMP